MTIALVEPTDSGSFHPLHVKFPPETRRFYRHSDHARFHERKQSTFVARARSDFPRGSASMTLRLESIACPRCLPHHRLEKCVSTHSVRTGSHTNVCPHCPCGSLCTLMCSLNSSNNLVLCTINWLQDGCTRVTECGSFLSQLPCHISASFSLPSTCPQMRLSIAP